jgi:hypothetical protein
VGLGRARCCRCSSLARAPPGGYRIRARRSASSSHRLAARSTSSLAGRPFGNSAASSASRSSAPLAVRRGGVGLRRFAARVPVAICARAVWLVRRAVRALREAVFAAAVFVFAAAVFVFAAAVFDFAAAVLRRGGAADVLRVRPARLAVARARRDRAALTAPTTPWAWRRCAPNAAARLNVRPHSGHLNAPLALLDFAFSAIALLSRSIDTATDTCSIRGGQSAWRLICCQRGQRAAAAWLHVHHGAPARDVAQRSRTGSCRAPGQNEEDLWSARSVFRCIAAIAKSDSALPVTREWARRSAQFVKPAIATIAVRIAISIGALLLAGGARGERMALPNAKIVIHELGGGLEARRATSRFTRGTRSRSRGGSRS